MHHAVAERIKAARRRQAGGDPEGAGRELARLWAEVGEHGDAATRATIARLMASLQDDAVRRLAWEQEARRAARDAAPES